MSGNSELQCEEILGKYDARVADLGNQLRNYLLEKLPDIIEMADVPGNVIGYGYGTGYKDTICTIIPSKKGIKLGFYKGATLDDPHNLLGGTGKVHKYAEIRSVDDLRSEALNELIIEALKAYRARRQIRISQV